MSAGRKSGKTASIIGAVIIFIVFIIAVVNVFVGYSDYTPIRDSTGWGEFEGREYVSEKLGFKIDFHGSWVTQNEDDIISDMEVSEKTEYYSDNESGFRHIIQADTPYSTLYVDVLDNFSYSDTDLSSAAFDRDYADYYKSLYDDRYGVDPSYSTIKSAETTVGGKKMMYWIYAYNMDGLVGGYIDACFNSGASQGINVYGFFSEQQGAEESMDIVLHKITAV